MLPDMLFFCCRATKNRTGGDYATYSYTNLQGPTGSNMSSNIKIKLTCEHCAQEFIARTTVTRFCSDNCAKRNYKKRIKDNKIKNALVREHEKKLFDPNISLKEFISIKEAELLLGASRWTIYKLIESKKILAAKLGTRTIIQKKSINELFMLGKP